MAKRETPLAEKAQGFFDLLAEEHRPVAEGKAKVIPLEQIVPDFEQPRRVLPGDLYRALRVGDIQPRQAIAQLAQRAKEGNLIAGLILGNNDEDSDGKGLCALAASIRHVGLRQPPTVYEIRNAEPGQPRYRIAEGERRYWAHQWLVLEGHDEFAEMPCLIETMPDDPLLVRARQVAENAMRRGLSAIARARAFAEVKKAIEREFLGTRVPENLDRGREEGEFLGTRVPENLDRGREEGGFLGTRVPENLGSGREEGGFLGTRVPENLGSGREEGGFLGTRVPENLSSSERGGRPRLDITSNELDDLVAKQVGAVNGRPVSGRLVRNYLRLLTLPADVQELAGAANLTEKQLRHLFKLGDRPDLQTEVVHKIVAEKLSSRDVQTLVEDIIQRGSPAGQAVHSRVKHNTPQDRLRQVVRSGLRIREQLQGGKGEIEDAFYYDLLTTAEYQDVHEQLLELHEWLAGVVERLENVGAMGLSLPARSRYDDVAESGPN